MSQLIALGWTGYLKAPPNKTCRMTNKSTSDFVDTLLRSYTLKLGLLFGALGVGLFFLLPDTNRGSQIIGMPHDLKHFLLYFLLPGGFGAAIGLLLDAVKASTSKPQEPESVELIVK